jgi:Domain of unknown function (DUF4407)
MDGTSGTKNIGVGKIAMEKKKRASKAEQFYNSKKAELNRLNLALDNLSNTASEKIDQNPENASILLRIEAMHSLVGKKTDVLIAYILFTLIFFILEFMVVIAKYGMKKTAYEHLVDLKEHIAEKRVRLLMNPNSPLLEPGNFNPALAEARKSVMLKGPGVLN